MNRQKIIALFAVSSLLSLHAYADSPASSLTSEDRTKAEVTVSADLYIEGNELGFADEEFNIVRLTPSSPPWKIIR